MKAGPSEGTKRLSFGLGALGACGGFVLSGGLRDIVYAADSEWADVLAAAICAAIGWAVGRAIGWVIDGYRGHP